MSKAYMLYYMDELVAVACKRLQLSVYLAQKGIYDLDDKNIEIKRVSKSELGAYTEELLEEHDTGFIVSPSDEYAFNMRKEDDELTFNSLMSDLEDFSKRLNKPKDLKKIKKAIKVVKKNAGKFKGMQHEIAIMKEIIEVPLDTIVEENAMNRNYRMAVGFDCQY